MEKGTYCRGLFYTPAMSGRFGHSFTDSFNSDDRRRCYEGHRSLALLMILFVFLSLFAGLFVANLSGAAIGLLLTFATYYLTPYLRLKIGG